MHGTRWPRVTGLRQRQGGIAPPTADAMDHPAHPVIPVVGVVRRGRTMRPILVANCVVRQS